MHKVIYIAGKMSGLPDLGRRHFREAEKRLKEAGYIVLNPSVLPANMEKNRYMPICLSMLDAADAIYMLGAGARAPAPGWSGHTRSTREKKYSRK